MKNMKRNIHKLSIVTMCGTLLCPIFLSSTVSAAENSSLMNEQKLEDKMENNSEAESIIEEVYPIESESESESEESNNNTKDTEPEEESKTNTLKETNQVQESDSNESLNEENSINEEENNNDSIDKNVSTESEDESKDNSEGNLENIEYYSREDTIDRALKMMEEEKATNKITTFSLRRGSVSKTDAFINAASPIASSVAEEYNLYASVMIAQAALESAWGTSILAYSPNHNLFGIKGDYNGESFSKYTKEYSDEDGWHIIKAAFKKYPSYKESFLDNADKLRNGVSWDKNYYNGTWKEKTKSYKDATKWLTGRYATDPTYNEKLNDVIEKYDLTRFDTVKSNDNDTSLESDIKDLSYDEVITKKDVKDYIAYINNPLEGIYSEPKGINNSKVVASLGDFFGKPIIVKQEKTTENGENWALAFLNGKELGWINKSHLSENEVVTSEKAINYSAKINRKIDGINSLPYGVKGYKTIASSSDYYGKEVKITREKVTNRATWALISINGKELGWIDKAGLDIEKVTSENEVNYSAYIEYKNDGINTKPWGTEGFETTAYSSEYYGKKVVVTKEAKTRRATWALISIDGKELGWIDKNGLTTSEVVLSEKTINYSAKIKRKTDGINTKPYGVKDYKTIASSSDYYGKNVKITREAGTNRATWALISINGKELGWIDKNGLDIEKVTSTKSVNYSSIIGTKSDGINTKPWGTEGFKTIAYSSEFYGKRIDIVKEAVTRRATWALISINGKELGWIDKNALTNQELIISEKTINYSASVKRKIDGINSKPYGVKGYKTLSSSSDYYGQEVKISKEAVTARATWALISLNGKELGWIDKAGLDIEKITSSKNVDYSSYIGRKTDGINSKPWGTEGFETLYLSSQYYGRKVDIVKEAITRRATWALISVNGKELGWIDKVALTNEELIISQKPIKYVAILKRKTDGINTKPYGVDGYKTIALSSKYYNQEVKITKEAVTNRATWALISLHGRELGWIDKNALDIEKVTSTKNVNYSARITRKNDGFNTKPWGTEGFETNAYSKDYFGAEVKVEKEAETRRATWALISYNNKNLGWIDKASLKVLNPNQDVVIIDAGHGDDDPGASAGGIIEKELNLNVALKVQKLLESKGYDVIMTRTNDEFLELSERASLSNVSNADIFVSIHTNAFNGISRGIETYSYNKNGNATVPIVSNNYDRIIKSAALALSIQDALIEETGAYDRGDKEANFHVLRETGMPAVLVEMGFVDNATERAKLKTDSYKNRIANGIMHGIEEYFDMFE